MVVFYTTSHDGSRPDWVGAAFANYLAAADDGAARSHELAVLSLLADKEFADLAAADVEREVLAVARRLRQRHLRGVLRRLEQEMRTVETSSPPAPDRLQALAREFQTVSAELLSVDNGRATT
jgi:hypothetical protein